MARRKLRIGLASVVAQVTSAPDEGDDVTNRVLDAAADLLASHGLRRWTVEDVADRAGVGRTSVYRRFEGRDQLVHAVLARELRETLAAIDAATAAHVRLEDKLLEAALVGLRALRGSLVERLLHSDPATFLPFLTTGAGPLLATARQFLGDRARAVGAPADPQHAAELAELAARLALSFILTRDTVFPIDDADAARASLRRLLRPFGVLTP